MRLINHLLIILVSFFSLSESYFTDIRKCKYTTVGREYIGNTNVTENGRGCIKWSTKLLEQFMLQRKTYVDRNVESLYNYCRNPTNFPFGPWCFIDEETLEWEYCNIPNCYKNRNSCSYPDGMEYIGEENISKSGKSCQSWTLQNEFPGNSFPEKNLEEVENKCRNPGRNMTRPWCFTNIKRLTREACNVSRCFKRLGQIEYFDGNDFIKHLRTPYTLRLNQIHENITVFVSVASNQWTSEVEKESSLWSTDYNINCQEDLNGYEYCLQVKSSLENEYRKIVYQCLRPLKFAIFITPLERSTYKIKYEAGNVYEEIRSSNEELLNYKKKVNKHLSERDRRGFSIGISNNYGDFYLIENNVIPYAVTTQNKVIFSISNIGKGRVGFMGSEKYISSSFKSDLSDFFHSVYGENNVNPTEATIDVIEKLNSQKNSGKIISTHLIWNSHNRLGTDATNVLLELVKYGLRIVIGIKPWAYHHYLQKLPNSELKPLFLAAGVWPSLNSYNDNITILNEIVIETFPLVHILDYAGTSLLNAVNVSPHVTSILLNMQFEKIMEISKLENIRKGIKKLFPVHLSHVKSIIPCLNNPVQNNSDKAILGLINALLIQPLGNKFIAPGLSFYPGKIQLNKSKIINVIMSLNLKFDDEKAQLGLYMPPGEDISVEITKSKSKTCTLYVNFHLFNVFNKDEWNKWPVTNTEFELEQGKLKKLNFAFGGLLSLSCEKSNDFVEIKLMGVTQVPMYDRRDDELSKDWKKMQQSSSPWAIIAGDTVVFIVCSSAIRSMAEPGPILELYDSMIKEQLHLRGKSVSESKREIISTDIQILAGYMHAGYPIGTMIHFVANPGLTSSFIFDQNKIKREGEWGILHEVGHNLQDSLFTFTGSGEITNNIFTLVGIESMINVSSWSLTEGWLKEKNIYESIITYINGGTFADWKLNPFIGLGIYAQLRNSFGWELYAQIFRRYNILAKENKKKSDSEKIQLWIKETSLITAMNLCPLYELWKWPIEEETNKELSNLPSFMPIDFLTKRVQGSVDEIIQKYGGSNAVVREPLQIPITIGTLKDKMKIEGQKVIEKIQILNE